MIIDLSCPIELRGYELLHDDGGVARAYIDLFNVSDETISGYTGTARWTRDETGEGASDYISVDEIAIPGGGEFKLMLMASSPRFADRLEIYFSGVTFQDGRVWKPEDGELVDVGETVPLEGQELENLKRLAGEDAIMYPETQDNFWRCVCGRINPLSEEYCARCRREMSYVLSELNKKTLRMDESERQIRQKRKQKSRRASSKSTDAKRDAHIYMALLAAATIIFLAAAMLITLLK